MGHVRQQACLDLVTHLSHAGVVDEASMGTGTSYDGSRSEEPSSECQLVIVRPVLGFSLQGTDLKKLDVAETRLTSDM